VKRALSGLDLRIDAAHTDFFETNVASVADIALRDAWILDCAEKNWVFRFDECAGHSIPVGMQVIAARSRRFVIVNRSK
jgi:hypothetical protein